ncbi:hypothetical protein IIA16_01600 [bacterium]|nr:hypothetical protein [bacterium]
MAAAFDSWVAGYHEPVGDEVHIWRDRYMAWRESDWPKGMSWLARWVDRKGMDPTKTTLAALHRELVPYLLASPHHEEPVWTNPPASQDPAWRLAATVDRASGIVKALLVEAVGEGNITVTPETVVTAVEPVPLKGPYVITHNVWSHISAKLWDPEWDWSQVRVRQA